MEALSNWLGAKPYMMGAKPCDLDCSAFGFLAIFFLLFPETYHLRVVAEERFPNLRSYVERVRDEFWPDWEDLLDKS
jgi:glutathione S-transferase